ncbi:MAG: PQQ-binding-like beta-propeller repeat protein [Gemmatimonadota bacterium]|nr:PQQ-binding-like beta-propeller repeat protein [Gemmatimonadota bacterium]
MNEHDSGLPARSRTPGLILALLLAGCATAEPDGMVAPVGDDWPYYGGDPGGLKYSPLEQIDRGNVAGLEVAWVWETGEAPIPEAASPIPGQPVTPGAFEATPIVINDTMWVVTPYNRVVALDASTGTEHWTYDPRSYEFGNLHRGCRFCHRGIAQWSNGSERRIYLNTRWRLIALDAATGRPIESFGDGGEADLAEHLSWEASRLQISNTSPPVVFENLVIVGSGVPDDRWYRHNVPGDVQAFDAVTGEHVWTFHTIPREGELGVETWEGDAWSYTGSANVWAPFTLDAARGLVYLPVSTPNNDFYGGERRGDGLFGESVVCLDARTGERVWHFQTVHHGLWDYDLPAPPNLVSIEVDGRRVDAVVALGKTGFAYVLDRVTGTPLWPIEERPVPESTVPGEVPSPTQPFPTHPAPLSRQGIVEDELIDFTPALRAEAIEVLSRYRVGPMFTPPSLEGTVMLPGIIGGVGWGGGAVDPTTGILYVKTYDSPALATVVEAEPGTADADYVPRFGGDLSVADGLPILRPPYASVTAVDLDTGEHVWRVPFGDDAWVRDHPALARLDLPPMGGRPQGHGSSAGPLVTAGGLVFVAGGEAALHALDAADGRELWAGDLAGGIGRANPMTYRAGDGRQMVVVAVSASGMRDSKLVAFALPR